MRRRPSRFWSVALAIAAGIPLLTGAARCDDTPSVSGIYQGVETATWFGVSPPLSSLPPMTAPSDGFLREVPSLGSNLLVAHGPQDADPLVQREVGGATIAAPILSFDGVPNLSSLAPPSPMAAVGPNHYVVVNNSVITVYDKVGTELLEPVLLETLWQGIGGSCPAGVSFPWVLYDQMADRWLVAGSTLLFSQNYLCVAISASADPTGVYHLYAFQSGDATPSNVTYGVWPNGYYVGALDFDPGFVGVRVHALERDQMLNGDNARIVSFDVPTGTTPWAIGDGLLPADLDGPTLPPVGRSNYFVGSMDQGGPYNAPQDALTLWKFALSWAHPERSSFALTDTIPVASFDSIFPCSPTPDDCIPQPDTTDKLDVWSYRQRLLPRLAYRNFGTHESLVAIQAVEAAPGLAGLRWYELRDPSGSPTIHQQGTYAPGVTDGIHRWNGSIGMDGSGNIALSLSASNANNVYPSVWYTGRLASDPLGTLPQGEGSIVDGTGSQTNTARWGDHSSISVDPLDDCTFWTTNQYVPVTGSFAWQLRIGAFKFQECLPPGGIFIDGFETGDTLRWSSAAP